MEEDEEIEQELSRIPILDGLWSESPGEEGEDEYDDIQDNNEDELSTGSASRSEQLGSRGGLMQVTDELPDSVLSCLQFLKSRGENTEKLILQDLEFPDTCITECYATVSNHASDYLDEFASEYDEGPDALRKRVLAEIEDEDQKERSHGDNCIQEDNRNNKITKGSVLADKLDRGDMILSLDYIEVEEKCRQKLLQWEEEQQEHSEMRRNMFSAEREMRKKETQEHDERRQYWREDFAKESSRLNSIHKELQDKFDEEVKKNNEVLAEDLKQHEDLINKMKVDLEKERNAFEVQKAKAEKLLEELKCKSAVKIQTAFRRFQIYRKYAPILKERKEEMKRKKELESKMEQERKGMEEKTKRKLEERKQKEDERKQKEEFERRKMEEAGKIECLKQEMRRREYEKKKEEEKQRLESAKLVQELKKKQLAKMNTLLENNDGKETYVKDGRGKIDEQTEGHVHLKPEKINKTLKEVEKEHIEIKDEIKAGIDSVNNGMKILTEQLNVYDITTKEIRGESMMIINTEEHKYNAAQNLVTEEQLIFRSNKSSHMGCDTLYLSKQIPDNRVQISSVQPNATFIGGHTMKSSIDNKVIDTRLSLGNRAADVAMSSQEELAQNGQSEDTILSISARALVLPDHIEEKRLAWMKTCIPWSKILRGNERKKLVKKTRQYKMSAAKKLPPLNADVILQNGPWHALRQVTTVTLQDLPGCSLTTLSECTKLQYLSLRRCRLTALEGLSNCTDLQYIDVQENLIQIINCEDLENLCILLLNKNQVTSIHGIDNCTNLRNLELSFNSITRIGGLESLKNLQWLVLDHNQLISSKGLEAAPTIMYLDCSYNYLTELEGIQNCGLLQILKLQGNNLCKPPTLNNHVLLREIYLDDNNLSAVEGISSCWLPLLQVLSISQNSLTRLSPLNSLILLGKLDISSNCLSDLQSVTMWLEGSVSLRELLLSKNPLLQEANWRCSLLKILPNLRLLNDEHIHSEDGRFKEENHKSRTGSFLAFCQAQIQKIDKIWQKQNTEGVACFSLDAVETCTRGFKDLMKLSNEHRYAHEYGDLDISEREEPEVLGNYVKQPDIDSHQHDNSVISGANEMKQDDPTRQITSKHVHSFLVNSSADPEGNNQGKKIGELSTQSRVRENLDNRIAVVENEMNGCETMKAAKWSPPVKNKEHSAAIIQSHWRGYVVRRDISYYAKLHEAASVIQSAWQHYCIRKNYLRKICEPKPDILKMKEKAATVIQAVWKGYFLRNKLAAAFAAIEKDELEDDFEEVNLDDFTFDESAMEEEWILNSTCFPSKTQHLSSKPERPKLSMSIAPPEDKAHSLPWLPHPAWQCDAAADSAFIQGRPELDSRLEKQNLSHMSNMKSDIDVSFKSEKEEKISQEWGFKDVSTAQLMLKRAQKMKSKQGRTKKLLDPAVRLALFKNNENKHLPVKPPKKVQPMKVEYFRDTEEEYSQFSEVHSEKIERSRELTYQWLHTQCRDFETTSSKIMKCKHFLPELNPEALNGGRVQLVGLPPALLEPMADGGASTADTDLKHIRQKPVLLSQYHHGPSTFL
ncbi:leucine-rich repeat- and IQ domain-containing protein 1 isoform X2 [Ascaphus truei]|uniref:leucine-rich repeat- and IQ domain-containing protein 1 isoform X2 n=1 Tax=Ascaphus truei TaxID=8439 RepID=UPI003F5A6B04